MNTRIRLLLWRWRRRRGLEEGGRSHVEASKMAEGHNFSMPPYVLKNNYKSSAVSTKIRKDLA